MNGKITEELLVKHSKVISEFISDPRSVMDYEHLFEYLNYYSFLLNQLNLKCKVNVDLNRGQCLACQNIFKLSQQPRSLKLVCNHGFCSEICAKSFLDHYTGGNLVFWYRVYCTKCNAKITRNFVNGLYGTTAFAEMLTKLEYENEPNFDCEICTEKFKIREGVTLDCNHRYCKNCLKGHLEIKIGEAQVQESDLSCPQDNVAVNPFIIKDVVSEENFAKYQKFAIEQWAPDMEKDEIYFRCKNTDCDYKVILLNNVEEYECQKCKVKVCPKCNEVVHKGCSCEAFKTWKEENSKGDAMFELMLKQSQWVQCPWCKQVIERVSGCQYMTCFSVACRGKKYFCFNCKRGLNADHQPHQC